VALLDYVFTIIAVLFGAVWIGIGQNLGKEIWDRWLLKKFRRWADKYDEKHEKHIKPIIDSVKGVRPPPSENK
jgi:hypothetical protein